MSQAISRIIASVRATAPRARLYTAPEYRFLYGRDSGAGPDGRVGLVAIPESAREVRLLMAAAHAEGVSVTPRGAGLNLAGLTVPTDGGIVLDLGGLSRVIGICPERRMAEIEAGVTLGGLARHLRRHAPELRFSAPDAPPSATVTGNCLFYGSGILSGQGIHSELIAGVRAVLFDGTEVQTGTFSAPGRVPGLAPGPDDTRWFLNRLGTTGVVTHAAIRLFPAPPHRAVRLYMIPRLAHLGDTLGAITETGLQEDLLIGHILPGRRMTHLALVFTTGETPEAATAKQAAIAAHLANTPGAGTLPVPDGAFPEAVIRDFLAEFKDGRGTAGLIDARQGGGFVYLGADFALDRVAPFLEAAIPATAPFGFNAPTYTVRNIGRGHHAIVTLWFPFNRADAASMETAEAAVACLTDLTLEMGGVPWKPAPWLQDRVLRRLHPQTLALHNEIQSRLNPGNRLAPQNWGVPEEIPWASIA